MIERSSLTDCLWMQGTASATADLSVLEGRYPHAVRLAWPMAGTTVGKDDDMCCVTEVRL